jgi:hypothetical protein
MVGFFRQSMLLPQPEVVEMNGDAFRPKTDVSLVEVGQFPQEHSDPVQVPGFPEVEGRRLDLLVPEVGNVGHQQHLLDLESAG